MRWDCSSGSPRIWIAGGSGGVGDFEDHLGELLLPFTNFTSYHITGITATHNQDVSDFVLDPSNNDLYCILSSGNTPFVNNRIYKNTFPYSTASQQWNVLSGYTVLREDNNVPFMGTYASNAINTLSVTADYLFYWDGKNLKSINKLTGATVGTPVTFPWTALMQQGIFADGCNNVYIGTAEGTIKVLRFNGTSFDDNAVPDISIPGYLGKCVYSLAYNRDRNLLYVGGDGFVGAFDLSAYCIPPSPPPPIKYNIVINQVPYTVSSTITPAVPAGSVINYTLLNGATIIGTNSTGTFTNLDPLGDYTLNADIIQACTSAQAATTFKFNTLSLQLKAADACGTNGGIATANASGGFQPYTYSMDGINFQQSNIFSNLPVGSHTITVKDATGNTVAGIVTISFNDLFVEAGNNTVICEGTVAQLAGNSNGTVVLWSPAAGLDGTSIEKPQASPTATTKYYFSANKGSCTLTDSLIVQVLPAPVANAGIDTSVCYGTDGMLHGSGGFTYSWKPATFLSSESIAEPTVQHCLNSVMYTLQVTDASGCRSIKVDTVYFRVIPKAQVSAGGDTVIAAGQPLQLQAIDVNNSGFNQYTWSPAFGLNNEFTKTPVAVIDHNITYTITALTPEGCGATGAVKVTVYKGPDVYVPNAFTPNSDGHNDVFRITVPGIKTLYNFAIFNRWGQEVFQTVNPLKGWDGSFNGTPQGAGVFVWMVDALDYTGKVIKKRGTVLLIR